MATKNQSKNIKKGGRRPGSGRNPKAHKEKKTQIQFGVVNEVYDELGGREKVIEHASEGINKAYKKKLKQNSNAAGK